MGKIAYLFPGQGSQKVGMGKAVYEVFPEAKRVFEEASDLLGFSLPKLCFEENNLLNRTEYTQAALLTTSMAILAAMNSRGFSAPDMAAGLSLGEYSALTAIGALAFHDAIQIVWKRGNLMEKAVPSGKGGMAAVLGLDAHTVQAVLDEMHPETDAWIQIANDNCPGQLVISGHMEMVKAAIPLLENAGAKGCVVLQVSGPFHSRLLSGVGIQMEEVLKPVEIHSFSIPYVSNVLAQPVERREEVKELLCRQVSSPVLWRRSIETMRDMGVDTFVEIGPGKTLSSFVRKTDRSLHVFHVDTIEEMQMITRGEALWKN